MLRTQTLPCPLLRRPTMLAACALWCATSLVAQTVPSTLAFQGRLATQSGTPVNGTVQLTLKLHDSPTGTLALWQEVQNAVSVNKGLFHVRLGSVTGFPPNLFDGKKSLYLSVQVGTGAEMRPRMVVTSQAFAKVCPSGPQTGAEIFGQLSTEQTPLRCTGMRSSPASQRFRYV